MYKEYPYEFSQTFDTYVIAYCPDTGEFFATNERGFFWEYDVTFATEIDAINYFTENIGWFSDTEERILSEVMPGHKHDGRVWLANTKQLYSVR